MGVREKMKKAFGGKKSGDNSPSDIGTPKIPGIVYYKPGEIPKSKYRGKWDQDHQDKLHAFSFAAAFRSRRGSEYSSYSPSGMKAQSRRASYFSKISKSDVDEKSLGRKSTNPARVTEDAENKGNVSNEIPITADGRAAETSHVPTTNGIDLEKTVNHDDTLFSPEELTRALTATNLEEKET